MTVAVLATGIYEFELHVYLCIALLNYTFTNTFVPFKVGTMLLFLHIFIYINIYIYIYIYIYIVPSQHQSFYQLITE